MVDGASDFILLKRSSVSHTSISYYAIIHLILRNLKRWKCIHLCRLLDGKKIAYIQFAFAFTMHIFVDVYVVRNVLSMFLWSV